MSLEKALLPILFPNGCGAYDGIGGLLPYLKQIMSTIFFYFYIISTILTLDVPSATSCNSTIECYKTFMFGERCTKIKMPTSSMVRN
jgi:hypothetical protein